MELTPGIVELSAANAELVLHTTAEGAASAAGHNLTLRVAQWKGTVTVSANLSESSVQVRAELPSLVVVGGHGGVKPLTEKDKATILRHAAKSLGAEQFPTVTFTSTSVDVADDAQSAQVTGELDLHGQRRAITWDVTNTDDVVGQGVVRQSDFGVTPHSAMLGALRVGDDVTVILRSARMPAPSPLAEDHLID